MSMKRFNADVRACRSRVEQKSDILGITGIELADSDGEVIVTFVHPHLPEPLSIRLLSQHVDNYPDGNNFLVFTDGDNVPADVAEALESLQNYTFGQPVMDALITLSTGLCRVLDRVDGDGDTTMGDVSDDSDEEQYDFDDEDLYSDHDDDHEFGLAPERPSASDVPGRRLKVSTATLKRIKRDLRKARDAGCKVGIIDGAMDDAVTHTFSLSIRASKLSISDDVLEAWDLEPTDYVVLLLKVKEPYLIADKAFEQPTSNFHLSFRIGKCCRYKPSPEAVRTAFGSPLERAQATSSSAPESEDKKRSFQKLFISKSLEQFMNEDFLSLFKLRKGGCSTWDEANSVLKDVFNALPRKISVTAASEISAINADATKHGKGKEVAEEDTKIYNRPRATPNILLHDSFAGPMEDMSLPLVSMQFALHYFTRCTEYCLRCHRRLDEEFEALKPFVCSDPLCLFQYITMGFGPCVEHEIITQPYVVDLLVSLCYSSVRNPSVGRSFAIRDFPTGLRLKVWNQQLKNKRLPAKAIKVRAALLQLTATVKDKQDLDRVSAGAWAMLTHRPKDIPDGLMFRHQVLIKYVDHSNGIIELEVQYPDPTRHASNSLTGDMDFFPYDTEFDDLNDEGKATVMTEILSKIPPIAHLRKHLIDNPLKKLRSCPGMSPAAATLLEWIVASNRSCILQVSPVDDDFVPGGKRLDAIKTRDEEIVPAMRSCVQFRFAQGNPDKEHQFHRALRQLESKKNTKYPTIFAWHGSGVQNWHSILRQGLDFKVINNGRSYGNGVYFSQSYETSMSYTKTSSSWPNSALKISGVISLCEILNSPEKFVSSNPHLVVSQVDWIQCRYLFVSRRDSGELNALPKSTTVNEDIEEIPQDPKLKALDPKRRPLKIPIKALPSSRSVPQVSTSKRTASKRPHDQSFESIETDEEDVVDLEALYSDDEAGPSSKKLHASRESSADTATARRLTTKRPLTPPMTDFRPGRLDLSTIPRLALPQWADANSTRRLASDIKSLQKAQSSTPLHELGWYVDFDKIENMFQWIVELHSFDPELPLAKDMKKAKINSIVLEVRFGRDYPFSPPFVRVIRPRFLPFMNGGGGHVTIGGALCMELLTSSGWTPTTSLEAVFVSVKMAISSTDPRPARLDSKTASFQKADYLPSEALSAFMRAAGTHGWKVPSDIRENANQTRTMT